MRNKLVALTGNSGSGKTTVAEYFKEFGAKIIDADELAREAINKKESLSEIRKHFGKEVFDNKEILNRRKLASIIFKDKDKKKILENLLHPIIRKLFKKKLKSFENKNEIILYVVPLFFESKYEYPNIEKTILVYSDREDCLNRIIERDAISAIDAENRLNAQIPDYNKLTSVDYTIKNDSNLETLKTRTSKLYNLLESL